MAKKPTNEKPMTRPQIVEHMSTATGMNKKLVKQFFEEWVALAITEARKSGYFMFYGIGPLTAVQRAARIGRNPATGEAIKIPAKRVVKARVSKPVRDAIAPPKKKAA